MWDTKITRRLGIKLPLAGAGTAIVGSPELTAAISNAGGIGVFCLGPGPSRALQGRCQRVRRSQCGKVGRMQDSHLAATAVTGSSHRKWQYGWPIQADG